jgi:hypothetical protein
MTRKSLIFVIMFCLVVASTACSPAPEPTVAYDPNTLSFSGERAFALEEEFVTHFPYRHSGQPNNQLAAEWLHERFSSYGLDCQIDEWQVINYSEEVALQNVVCQLAGESPKEILLVAHLDQAPTTIQGADNDGSGIAILLHLAEIFSSESMPRYTLTFVATDGEEYGMLGTRRFVKTHPNTEDIIAGVSLDNLGKYFYYNLEMAPNGQFRNYGPIWLLRTVQEASRAGGDLWVPPVRSALDQVLNQAVPVSFMDQGPLVAAGIPAFGFAGLKPADKLELHEQTYHDPGDTMELQSADVLYQSGRIPEALIRQLLVMDEFPQESGPYIYLESSAQVLRGLPLWLIFIGLVIPFFLGAFFFGGKLNAEKLSGWRNALPHFLSLWLPLLAAVILTYVLVEVGLMDKFAVYPGTPKDPVLYEPRWSAVIILLVGFATFLYLGRRFVQHYASRLANLSFGLIKSLAFLVIGLGAIYIMIINPFSLVWLVPLLFWLLISGRKGWRRILDILLFILGGLVLYVLLYFFGFVILKNNLAILWYIMMIFSIREVSFLTAIFITAIVGAGLSMIINPPLKAGKEETEKMQVKSAPADA